MPVRRYIPSWDSRAALRLSSRLNETSSASWPPSNFSLDRRQSGVLDQDVPPEMDDYCIWRCTVATCGCNLRSSLTAVTRRSASLSWRALKDPQEQWNNSTVDIDTTLGHRDSRLVARWPTGSEPDGQQRYTRSQLDEYLASLDSEDGNPENDLFFSSIKYLVVGPSCGLRCTGFFSALPLKCKARSTQLPLTQSLAN